jgi:hypothetical protein
MSGAVWTPVKKNWVFSGGVWNFVDNFTVPGSVPGISLTQTSHGTPSCNLAWTADLTTTNDDYEYLVDVQFWVNGSLAENDQAAQTAGGTGITSGLFATGDSVFAKVWYFTPHHSGPVTTTGTIVLT